MSRSRNSNNTGRNSETSNKNVSGSHANSSLSQRSASESKVEEGIAPTKANEADLLVQEIIQKGILKAKSRATYEISPELTAKIIVTLATCEDRQANLKKAVFNSVWQYYGSEDDPIVKKKVSAISRLVEHLIHEDRL